MISYTKTEEITINITKKDIWDIVYKYNGNIEKWIFHENEDEDRWGNIHIELEESEELTSIQKKIKILLEMKEKDLQKKWKKYSFDIDVLEKLRGFADRGNPNSTLDCIYIVNGTATATNTRFLVELKTSMKYRKLLIPADWIDEIKNRDIEMLHTATTIYLKTGQDVLYFNKIDEYPDTKKIFNYQFTLIGDNHINKLFFTNQDDIIAFKYSQDDDTLFFDKEYIFKVWELFEEFDILISSCQILQGYDRLERGRFAVMPLLLETGTDIIIKNEVTSKDIEEYLYEPF